MRPIRLLLFAASFLLAILILLTIGPSWRHADTLEELDERGRLGAYFNWHAPSSSLFPPSAIISLTDDNSTFFLARPAAFGPSLPTKSLSGQLWIGSGFGDDRISRGSGGSGAMSAEGELGCSDVPGWREGDYLSPRVGLSSGKKSSLGSEFGSGSGSSGSASSSSSKKNTASDGMVASLGKDKAAAAAGGAALDGNDDSASTASSHPPDKGDGTDDHLHHPLPASSGLKSGPDGLRAGGGKQSAHADIQSLQESAEIAGKIVLLSRGGCGFLEKVKWVQRRGGVALIVGDDIRGGPLVTMYARGDTSNVTIPALFTSHTTAHLLSSLMPSGAGGAVADESRGGRGRGTATGKGKSGTKKMTGEKGAADEEGESPKSKSKSSGPRKQDLNLKQPSSASAGEKAAKHDQKGWYYTFFGPRRRSAALDSRRPPRSGNIDWVLQEDFEDEIPSGRGKSEKASTAGLTAHAGQKPPVDDGFIIGVHDWRDPDLVDLQMEEAAAEKEAKLLAAAGGKKKKAGAAAAADSGTGKTHAASDQTESAMLSSLQAGSADDGEHHHSPSGASWFGRVFRGSPKDAAQAARVGAFIQDEEAPRHADDNSQSASSEADADDDDDDDNNGSPPHHHGLWVTLTPTSMSSSPFFDTLLVLVVSPLVTLTVVYALLLLRSRIRRRRWRAPKSVVEQLPVRTYHTVASTGSSSATSTTSSVCSETLVSATTPLLANTNHTNSSNHAASAAARPMRTRPRPRAQTTSQVPQSSSPLHAAAGSSSSAHGSPLSTNTTLDQTTEEKRAAGLAEWRRRYGGKQRECVVCLEEYVDGVSRVMSLPCGHEFHAECITPWLTTRRRTCPICKGDVVRSLAAATSSVSPPSSPAYHTLSSSAAVAARMGSFLAGGGRGSRSRRRRSRSRRDEDVDEAGDDDVHDRAAEYDSPDDAEAIPPLRVATTAGTAEANVAAARPGRRQDPVEEELDLERGIGVDRDR